MSQLLADRYINAAKDGFLDVLQQATRRDLNTPDEDGMTAVMWAAHNGHLDALRLIVGRGGDVDRCDFLGLTPMHHAAQKGLLHVVTFLTNWGANIFALDNDHHSPLDLASLYERLEVVQYLDSTYAQQQSKNPKHVARLREEALKTVERNIRRYQKLQEEAARRAQKEQRRLLSPGSQDGGSQAQAPQAASQRKQNIIKTLTMAIRGSKTQRSQVDQSGKSYSHIAGLNPTGSGKGGVAKRIIQRRGTEGSGTAEDGADFKISDVDDSGKRTLRSLSAAQGVRGMSAEVIYFPGDKISSADVSTSRPAVYEVFGGRSNNMLKAKSESDLLDSGVNSYFDDEEDENTPGIFNRPGFGKTAFLTGNNFLNTLPSFDGQQDGVIEQSSHKTSLNGFPSDINGEGLDNSLSEDVPWRGPKELPWDQEEVDTLDDDDEAATSSALEMFLWAAGLEAYLHKFLHEKIDMELLIKMSDTDLKDIGLPFGPRKRLLEFIQRRQEVLAMPKYITDSFL